MDTLTQLEQDFHHFLSSSTHAHFFYIHDAEGVFTYLSHNIVDLLGFTPKEFETQYLTHLTANPINKDVILHTNRSLNGIQQEPYKVEIYDKDYNIHILQVYERPIIKEGIVIEVQGVAKLLQ